MLDGMYCNPTTIFFGKDVESQVGAEVAKYAKKILLHFGGESFTKYGLDHKVLASLRAAGVQAVALGGVKPNPRASLVYEGIERCRKERIEFILAVGGGSVIDSAKAIAIGVPCAGDFFDFFEGKQVPQEALQVATILTVPGSGSESSNSAVITHEPRGLKLSCTHPLMFPLFSMLNPELTYTLTARQTACGIVDAIAHVLERYFSPTTYVDCTDRICEGLLQTLMRYALVVQKEPENYDVRAEIMWACKIAHDNTAGFGRKQDWASHRIAHELGANYDIPHGAALSVIIPAWMKFVCRVSPEIFVQFGERVFGLDPRAGKAEAVIGAAIAAFEKFLQSIGMPTTLRDLGIDDARFSDLAKQCVRYMPSGTIGNLVRLPPQDIMQILKMAD